MQTSAQALKESIAHFAFPLTPNSTPLRRSSRTIRSVQIKVKDEPSLSPEPVRPNRKRKLLKSDPDGGSPSRRRSPTKRGYAGPETYAHLNALNDHLVPNLDVIFCGINPGRKSATDGHHFANPTNHFWRCLHRSGFTPRIVPPVEDSTLPALYNLGLTNLVERPSIEEAELSKEEMKQSVPVLKEKIITHRPHIVCFVGKGIWLIIESAFKNQISSNPIMIARNDETKAMNLTPPPTPRKSQSRGKTTRKSKPPFEWGLQAYKFVYPESNDPDSGVIKSEDAVASVEDESARDAFSQAVSPGRGNPVPARETLLFVMPSTSGRVVSHQLDDKVKLFARLREDLERAKAGTLDTSGMVPIPLA